MTHDFFRRIIFSIVICLASCAMADELPRQGGSLVWGTINAPTVINPILTRQGVSSALLSLVFNSLVRVNAFGEIVPGLATSWDVSSDGLTYVFHLKPGVRFHDGVELTADDVKFTYDAIADPQNQSPWKDATADITAGQWQVVDKHTLKLSLKAASRFVLYKLLREIAPKHLLAGKKIADVDFNVAPVGTGPFRLKKWDRQNQEIILEANQDYFEGRPHLDRIVVRVYPDNTSLWAALMRKDVDFVKYLNQEDFAVLRKDQDFKTYEIAAGMCTAVVFNLKDPVLSDMRVRKALAHGINVEQMLKDIRMGGIPSTGVFQPDSTGFNPDVKPLTYDPLQAVRMLESAGWKDTDGDDILEKDGRPLQIKMLVDGRSGYYQVMAMIIRQQLSEIGIKLIVKLYQDEKELTQAYLLMEKPQAWLRPFMTFGHDPGTVLEQWYPGGDSLQTLWNYRNPAIDALIAKAGVVSDKAQRDDIYREVHQIIYEDQPACFLFFLVTRHAVARKFMDTDGFFSPSMPVYMMKDWYVLR